jgi:hypothetical protein
VLEQMRADKRIRAPLEATVTLTLPPRAYHYLAPLHGGVPQSDASLFNDVFLTSLTAVAEAEGALPGMSGLAWPGLACSPVLGQSIISFQFISLHPTGPSADAQYAATFTLDLLDAPGQTAHVVCDVANGHKCPRCWKRISLAEDTLCGRCAGIVAHITANE